MKAVSPISSIPSSSKPPAQDLKKPIIDYCKDPSISKFSLFLKALRSNGIQTVIFDMDGVLLNTEKTEFDLVEKYLQEDYGIELNQKEKLLYRGHDNVSFFTKIFQDRQLEEITEPSKEAEKFDKRVKVEKHKLYETQDITPCQHMTKMARDLKDTAFKIALVTNGTKEQVKRNLDYLKLHNIFFTQVTKEDVKNSKPAPDPYLKALKLTQTDKPETALVFEDSGNGVVSAKEAGTQTVYINNADGWELDEKICKSSYADYSIDFTKEL